MKKNVYEVIYFDVQEGCAGSIMLDAPNIDDAIDQTERLGEYEVLDVELLDAS